MNMIYLAIAVLTGVVPASATEYTIQNAVETALVNREEVAQADLSVSSANAELLGSRLWFTPSISADIAVMGIDTEFPEAETYSSQLELGASVNLFNLQSIGAGRISSAAAGLAEESARLTRASVIMDAAASCYTVLLDRASLEVAELNLSTQEEMFQTVKAKYEAGTVSRYEYLAGHVSLENARPSHISAMHDLENSSAALKLALALESSTEMELNGDLSEPLPVTVYDSPEELAEAALDGSSEVAMARLSLETAEASSFTASAGYCPSLMATGNVSWAAAGASLSDLEDADYSRTLSAGVVLHVPVFSSFSTETAVKTARNSLLTAELELERTESEIVQNALEAWNDYSSAQSRLQGANALVLEAREALDIAEISYEMGSITRLEMEQSILGLTSAKSSLAQAEYGMRMAELNMAVLTGEIHEIWEVE